MAPFSTAEQDILDELVRRRSTTFQRPPWMQHHRARAISAEARGLIDASSPRSTKKPPKSDTTYYETPARVRAFGGGARGNKIHEAGAEGGPLCATGQGSDREFERLDAGPVTCAKCAGVQRKLG